MKKKRSKKTRTGGEEVKKEKNKNEVDEENVTYPASSNTAI